MKSTSVEKLARRGISRDQAITVRYVYKPRAVEVRGPGGELTIHHYERSPEIAHAEVLLTAGQWMARFYEHRRTSKRKARRLRRADRAGRAAKR
jgi:hypothetical protein